MGDVILGIDTGGTYTDGVLLDYDTKKVIRCAKAFTTKECLVIGINDCISALNINNETVRLICLSTTLATNSVVEQKKTNVGMIVIGGHKSQKVKNEIYPVEMQINISGEIDIMGREVVPVNEDEIKLALKKMKGKVKTLAISGFASIKNPSQELAVKRFAEEMLNIPVVCAHELSATLGFYERTVTAALNARLIPEIWEFLENVQTAIAMHGITAPISMLKGDGNVLVGDYAKLFPVETILSGPAASAVGGRFLTNIDSAIIVDMGGTTTDIACIENGEVMTEISGMTIEGWKTSINSVKAHTYGAGGDSRIFLDAADKLFFGPQKVVPLCVAGEECPRLLQELEELHLPSEYVTQTQQETDCLRLVNNNTMADVDEKSLQVLELLKNGPHTLLYLAKELNTDIDSLQVKKLIDLNLVQLIALTPTDLLHADNTYKEWNSEISMLAIRKLAEKKGVEKTALLREMQEEFVEKVSMCIMDSIFRMDGIDITENYEGLKKVLCERVLKTESKNLFYLGLFLERPIIGVGAPASVWVRRAAQKLNTQFIGPEFGSVANAIGAAVRQVKEKICAVICKEQFSDNYIVFLPTERIVFKDLEESIYEAEQRLQSYAETLAERMLMSDPAIQLDRKDFFVKDIYSRNNIFIRTTITATVSGAS